MIAEHVGGGFGAKGMPRPNVILAAMAARVTGRPVKCAVTRQQMFSVTGHRAPSIQRVRLGADPGGRLVAVGHDVFDQTSTLKEFTEQSAVATRHMYAAPSRRTTHRVVRLDVPTPSWMRAPGECPGMFALESAMDELAVACGIDPVELRLRNEPAVHPETGQSFLQPEPGGLPAPGRRPVRLGRPRPGAAHAARRTRIPLADRDRGSGLDLSGPGDGLPGAGEPVPFRPLPGVDRRGGHRGPGRAPPCSRSRPRRSAFPRPPSTCLSATARCRPR